MAKFEYKKGFSAKCTMCQSSLQATEKCFNCWNRTFQIEVMANQMNVVNVHVLNLISHNFSLLDGTNHPGLFCKVTHFGQLFQLEEFTRNDHLIATQITIDVSYHIKDFGQLFPRQLVLPSTSSNAIGLMFLNESKVSLHGL